MYSLSPFYESGHLAPPLSTVYKQALGAFTKTKHKIKITHGTATVSSNQTCQTLHLEHVNY
jgi:hypothetical protein